jgi:hypothetical protein
MAQTRRMGKHNQWAYRPNAPRPPTQTSARPSLKGLLTERLGRDVGFAKSGFRIYQSGQITSTEPFSTHPLPIACPCFTKVDAPQPCNIVSVRYVPQLEAAFASFGAPLSPTLDHPVRFGRDVGSA